MKTIAVIPAYNEGRRIETVIAGACQYVDDVVVVDDGSQDDTYLIAKNSDQTVVVLQHSVNLGKGAALKTGCEAAAKLGADYIVCLDADNQHNPASIPLFIEALATQGVDIVFGVRQFNKNMPFMMFMGNRALSVIINSFFHILIHDTQSGFRAFTQAAYQQLQWTSTGYEVETEMIVRVSEKHLRYAEIDIDTIYHDHYKGTTVLDGIKIFFQILKWKLL